ncbi:beta-fructofuranosidase 1 [Cocos nucifera]|uniref:Beta-fructofuranosidase 1 n=1 Tax=Cocos nucifera TaxID=13894 RepID=A0A8K0IER9_COCNU|nr:beta-fructofuranosidase 1 [Cocos nucifera]
MDVPDLESPIFIPYSYHPLPQVEDYDDSIIPTSSNKPSRRALRLVLFGITTVTLLGLVSLFYHGGGGPQGELEFFDPAKETPVDRWTVSRGTAEGVSEKSNGPILGATPVYPWTNVMLVWQRTAFHFQPQENWMNDPNGPMYYKGWYHLFYQYNPESALWGNITWGHAVSRDLVHWFYLPLAMVPDQWYDANGVWTGSATLMPDGRIAMVYTGSTTQSVQVQNLAFPADPDDPLLIRWNKSESNPVIFPPPWVGPTDFRDPTTAWYVPTESAWRLAIGAKDSEHNGIALLYQTKDFITYELLPGFLHAVNGTGMWECVDFYPVSTGSALGLDTSTGPGPRVKYVLKASLDEKKQDYYAIGTYDGEEGTWTPDEPEMDVGIGLRYDYGKFYASKTFYDPVKERRVLWGWTAETDSEWADLLKGWASLQTIPRTVLYDDETKSNLIQWPVDEVESLRSSKQEFSNIKLSTGSVVPLDVTQATQVDIEAEFEIDLSALEQSVEADVGYNCSTSGGAAGRGALGPFGLLVLADQDLKEQTAVYFYLRRGTDGGLSTFFCQDEMRSSLANDIVKRVYGSSVPVLDGESLTVRILVDHSVIESFAQGGRACVTSRVYPTRAVYGGARAFLFNNATDASMTAKSLKIWQMDSAFLHPYSIGPD